MLHLVSTYQLPIMATHGMSQARAAVYTAQLLPTDALCTKWLLRSENKKSLVFLLFAV
jgi:hypothetical protein